MAVGSMGEGLAPDLSALLSEHDEDRADIALAQMLQEQEEAWFAQSLISPAQNLGNPVPSTSDGSGNGHRCADGKPNRSRWHGSGKHSCSKTITIDTGVCLG